MDERERLTQTRRRFDSEVERVLDGTFVNMPAPLVRLLDAIDSEPLISAYVRDCAQLLPSGFDAAREVDRVSADVDAVFGPFPADPQLAFAETYRIVRELARRRTKCHDPVFSGYGQGSAKLQDIARGFSTDILERLIGHVHDLLDTRADELGIARDAAMPELATPRKAAAEDATSDQAMTVAAAMRGLDEAIRVLETGTREELLLPLEALDEELACDQPKRSVVRVLLRGLRLDAEQDPVVAALDQLEATLSAHGIL